MTKKLSGIMTVQQIYEEYKRTKARAKAIKPCDFCHTTASIPGATVECPVCGHLAWVEESEECHR